MKKGLATKLVTKTAIITAIIFIVALVGLGLILRHNVNQSSNEKIQLTADTLAWEIEDFFNEHRVIAEQVAADPVIINFMKSMQTNPMPYGESPMWPTVHNQLNSAWSTHDSTLIEIYMGDWFARDIGSSNGEIMTIDYPGLDTTTRYWLKAPKETGETVFTAPFLDSSFGIMVCTIAAPVKDANGEVLGSVCASFSLDSIKEILASKQVGEAGYTMVYLEDGTVFYHPNDAFMERTDDGAALNISDLGVDENLVEAVNANESGLLFNFKDENGVKMTAVSEILDGSNWNVVVALPRSEAYAMASTVIIIQSVVLLLALIIILLVLLFTTRKAIRPVSVVAQQAADLALGKNLTDVTRHEKEEDEIDILINSFASLIEANNEQAHILDEVAAGNTDIAINPRSDEDKLSLSMQKMVKTLGSLVTETEDMTQNAILGNTSYRGDASKFVGGYKRIVEGFNATMEAVMKEINVVADVSAALGRGEVPEFDNNSQGDYADIMNALQGAVGNIKALVEDTQKLADAAKDEDYTVRADVSQYGGQFKTAMEGINNTLELMNDKKLWYETMLDGVPVLLQTVDNEGTWTFVNNPLCEHFIKKGLYKDTSDMEGKKAIVDGKDFSGVTELKAGKAEVQYSFDGNEYLRVTQKLVDASGKDRGYICVFQDITGVTRANEYSAASIERLQGNLENIAKGNFELKENTLVADEYQQAVAEQFAAIDTSIKGMTDSVQRIVEDVKDMSEAAVAGDLEKRIDANAHLGEYAEVAKEINATIDALLNPTTEVMEVLERVAGGDLGHMVEGDYRGGHAQSKNAMNKTITQLRTVINDISDTLTAMADGDLTVKVDSNKYIGDFKTIGAAMESIVEKLRDVMTNLKNAAEQVAASSKQLSDGASNLADGSQTQAAAVQQLGHTIEGVAEQTKKNTEDARKASELSTDVMHQAERGNSQMRDMLVSMEEINESSANISKIIKVIDDIAFQTNILALNAAVEAARAGVHGKGFAVVADEVRNLAAKSAEAASETTTLIEGSISKVNAGTEIANATAKALEAIVAGITETSNLCDAIADVSDNQASGIDEVNRGIDDVSRVVQTNSATAEESASSSQELYSQATMLNNLVAQFKLTKTAKQISGPTSAPSPAPAAQHEDIPEIVLDFDMNDKY